MGALDEGHLDAELDNRVKLGFLELGLGDDSGTAVIEDAVKVLLQGLGEDPNREGLRKTPLRVAKAFREGTTGAQPWPWASKCTSAAWLGGGMSQGMANGPWTQYDGLNLHHLCLLYHGWF